MTSRKPGVIRRQYREAGRLYSFGPFTLGENVRHLARDAVRVVLSDRLLDILLVLHHSLRPGGLSKDTLSEAAWKDVAVGDNSLEQAISSLHRLLGPAPDGSLYIETLARRGYRFAGRVTHSVARQTDHSLGALLAPYRTFLEGRTAVETPTRLGT